MELKVNLSPNIMKYRRYICTYRIMLEVVEINANFSN